MSLWKYKYILARMTSYMHLWGTPEACRKDTWLSFFCCWILCSTRAVNKLNTEVCIKLVTMYRIEHEIIACIIGQTLMTLDKTSNKIMNFNKSLYSMLMTRSKSFRIFPAPICLTCLQIHVDVTLFGWYQYLQLAKQVMNSKRTEKASRSLKRGSCRPLKPCRV